MPVTSVSLSTSAVPGPSSPIVLNWRSGRPVAWSVTTNSSLATSDFQVQATYDDIQLTPYSTVYPPTGSPTYLSSVFAVWGSISSTPYLNLGSSTADAPQHFTSSTIFPDGVTGVFLAPPTALRLYSTASSSNIISLKVVQGE
jgi:hypothetical protein